MKVEIDKNWCIDAAKREDGQEVGAGGEGLGPFVGLRLELTAAQKEIKRLTAKVSRLEDLAQDRFQHIEELQERLVSLSGREEQKNG